MKAEKEKMKAANVKESPFRSTDTTEEKTALSSPEQLLDLWDIANGQTALEEVVDTYVLELSWLVCPKLCLETIITSEQR